MLCFFGQVQRSLNPWLNFRDVMGRRSEGRKEEEKGWVSAYCSPYDFLDPPLTVVIKLDTTSDEQIALIIKIIVVINF